MKSYVNIISENNMAPLKYVPLKCVEFYTDTVEVGCRMVVSLPSCKYLPIQQLYFCKT